MAATFFYFIFFIFLMPVIGFLEGYFINYGEESLEEEIARKEMEDYLDQYDAQLWLLILRGEKITFSLPPYPPLEFLY